MQFVMILLTGSLALNVWLGLSMQKQAAGRHDSVIGRRVTPFRVMDSENRALELEFSKEQRPVVLYVLSPTCQWCEANLPAITALANNTKSRYRFVGLSLSDTRLEASTGNSLPFPVYSVASFTSVVQMNLGSTPQTLLIASDGTILRSWTGAYKGSNKTEIEKEFGESLPPIR
ncbi:MAG TPA: hypothetical protein VLA96_09790 [Terriglobales bacterium]|nr:hypothetical protein [Terriglobales bacterium]